MNTKCKQTLIYFGIWRFNIDMINNERQHTWLCLTVSFWKIIQNSFSKVVKYDFIDKCLVGIQWASACTFIEFTWKNNTILHWISFYWMQIFEILFWIINRVLLRFYLQIWQIFYYNNTDTQLDIRALRNLNKISYSHWFLGSMNSKFFNIIT